MATQQLSMGLYLTVNDTDQAIAFYTEVFEAILLQRECLLDGHVLEAELAVGNYRLTLSELSNGSGPDDSATTNILTFECDDPDLVLRRAAAAGAEVEMSPAGSANGTVVRDPAGQRWAIVGRKVAA